MNSKTFAVNGTFIYSETKDTLSVKENQYLIIEDGLVKSFSENKPENLDIYD